MVQHTCNSSTPTTVGGCLACAVESGLCTEYVVGLESAFCRQTVDHAGPHDFDATGPFYATREAYAVAVWASLDVYTQAEILADYGMTYGPEFVAAFTDNMDARHNGTVTFTAVDGGYVVDDEAGTL